ncbi:DUF397 domain-containing protein [Streptomyces varsoviensis]|uniref:DUF397 domain-containing protein n=1 Tax=Streptomyces varsoviensis TaxID=67373 RepID=A0ABR5JA19_9ACTN|nr:DUF397 domain-containing protein [Streptomyces varsoviensis]KOG90178.1 hypothetical protein ADK38_10155 [Streptomyces varsoviensis]
MAEHTHWQKTSFSGGGDGANCLQLAAAHGVVWLRESEAPGVMVTATANALRALLRSVKTGEFGSGSLK